MALDGKKNWWDDFYTIRCPNCNSKTVKKCEVYKYTFRKDRREIQKYICNECKLEFWE